MGVGKNLPRVDGQDKVSGRAKYVGDLEPQDALVAKVLRSTIANGVVLKFDVSQAEAMPGVVKIITCFQVPQHSFPPQVTPGPQTPATKMSVTADCSIPEYGNMATTSPWSLPQTRWLPNVP